MLCFLLAVLRFFNTLGIQYIHPLAHYDIIAFQCLFRLNNPILFCSSAFKTKQMLCPDGRLKSKLRSWLHLHYLFGTLHFHLLQPTWRVNLTKRIVLGRIKSYKAQREGGGAARQP